AGRIRGDTREVGEIDLVRGNLLVGHQLVGIGRDHCCLAKCEHLGFEWTDVERLIFRRDDNARSAEIGPQGEPVNDVALFERYCTLGSVEGLAALAQPVLQYRLRPGTILEELHLALRTE